MKQKNDLRSYPLVSFVIPTLNAEEFLPRCLTSIQSQTYPKNKIEILVVDGGSTDKTKKIAELFGARVLHNPNVFMEPAKTLGTQQAKGEIVFYVDADNILSRPDWLTLMMKPYMNEKNVACFLPQTIPDPTSHPIDRYFGYLFTDPFTWFIYAGSSNPKYYEKTYTPIKKTPSYLLYRFPKQNLPLFGFSQAVGAIKKFGHGTGYSDDLLSGIHVIVTGGIVAYVPGAGVYHHHITSLKEFIRKYTWRVKNNLKHRYTGVGISERIKFFSQSRKLRIYLFVPYAFSLVLPSVDAIKLAYRNKSLDMLLHVPLCFIMAVIIVKETLLHFLNPQEKLGLYE